MQYPAHLPRSSALLHGLRYPSKLVLPQEPSARVDNKYFRGGAEGAASPRLGTPVVAGARATVGRRMGWLIRPRDLLFGERHRHPTLWRRHHKCLKYCMVPDNGRAKLPAPDCVLHRSLGVVWSNNMDGRLPPLPSRRSRRAFCELGDELYPDALFPVSPLNIYLACARLSLSHLIGQFGGGELCSSPPSTRLSPSALALPLLGLLGVFLAPPAVAAHSARALLPCFPFLVLLW